MILILTTVTCTGGIAYLLWCLFKGKVKSKFRLPFLLLSYGCFWLLTPLLAMPFGRSRLPVNHDLIKPASWFYLATNRTFVKNRVKNDLENWADQNPNSAPLRYLDAAFPIEVPLLPHLSHGSGLAVDFTFCYDREPIGLVYGATERPLEHEVDYPEKCSKSNPFYGATKFLKPFSKVGDLDESKSRSLILSVVNRPQVQRIFLEPHLKQRWNLNLSKVRFHGCHAVRHDDHWHVDWK